MNSREQRQYCPENFSEGAKKRVKKATERLTKLRCLITNAPEIYSVEYAHILPQETDSNMLGKLEYSWGLQFGSFNVDSRYNIIRLNSILHRLFDDGQWFLLPEESILDKFNRQERPDQNFMNSFHENATYQYKFIPSRNLRAFEISRYSAPMEPRQTAGPANFEPYYYYPFDTLPIITSHAHPHFVIYNIGLKMKKHRFDFFGADSEIDQSHRRLIQKAIDIFDKWTTDIPAESIFFRDPFLPATDDDDEDNDSNFTREDRSGSRASSASFRTRSSATPSIRATNSRKRARAEETDGLWLDDDTLRLLDDDNEKRQLKRKKQSVSAWISSISEVHFDTLGE